MTQKPDPEKLARVIRESAHQIWSAGLGALSLAEKEGSRFFESLSTLGENIHAHTRSTADAARQTVSGGKAAATETWDKLEEMFELRVARALHSLQIPTAQDIHELSQRVEDLAKAVEKLDAARETPTGTKKKRKNKDKKKSEKKAIKKKKSSRKKKKAAANKKRQKS